MEFGYARVSTSHQNTDRQIEALLEYGIPERNIIVDKQSGKDFERVGYLALKNTMLRAGDTLVIKELDRLGRNKQMIKEELEWLKAHEIRVKILNVPTSLMECDGQDWILEMVSNILIEVMASIAEEERLKNHQRQSEGIQAAKNRGVVFGRPTVRKPENYAVMLTFIDRDDENRILRTYANSYDFKASDEEIRDYFYMNGNGAGNGIWNLYNSFNNEMPDHYIPLTNQYRNTVLNIIDEREHNEGFCCYNARHNGKNANGEQINRSGKNTAKEM